MLKYCLVVVAESACSCWKDAKPLLHLCRNSFWVPSLSFLYTTASPLLTCKYMSLIARPAHFYMYVHTYRVCVRLIVPTSNVIWSRSRGPESHTHETARSPGGVCMCAPTAMHKEQNGTHAQRWYLSFRTLLL